jgi:hypothetical protein
MWGLVRQFVPGVSLRVVLPKEPHKKNPVKRTGFFRFFSKRTQFFWVLPKRTGFFWPQKNRVLLAPVVLNTRILFPRHAGAAHSHCHCLQTQNLNPPRRKNSPPEIHLKVRRLIRAGDQTEPKITWFFWPVLLGPKEPGSFGENPKEPGSFYGVLFVGFFWQNHWQGCRFVQRGYADSPLRVWGTAETGTPRPSHERE